MKKYLLIMSYVFLFLIISCDTAPTGTDENETNIPTIDNGAGIDASIRKELPDLNQGNFEVIETGIKTSDNGGNCRGLLKFDLTNLSASVQKVTLKLYQIYGNGHSNSGTTKIYRITTDWDEHTVTWNTQPLYSSTVYASTQITNSDGWVSFGITNLYNEWKSGTPNFGMLINTEGSGYAPGRYWSSDHSDNSFRPLLDIEY